MIRIRKGRAILSDKLLKWFVEQRIDSPRALRIFYFVYSLLSRGYYIREHNNANHHFIPRFLLKKFQVDDTEKIFEYKRRLAPKRISIKRQAALAPNLYTFRDKRTKMPSDFIEKQVFGHLLEKYGSRVINRILEKDRIDLTNLEGSVLASFIAFQYTRTPRFFYQLRLVLAYLIREKGVMPEEMAKTHFAREAFIDNRYQLLPREVARYLQRTTERIAGVENLLLRLMSQIANDISGRIFFGQLNLLSATGSDFFFLSDNPAEIFNFDHRRSIGPFLWELSENVLTYLPISPTRCIYYTHRTRLSSPSINSNLIQTLSLQSIHESAYSDRVSPVITAALQ